jgi:hypothetical protein
VSAPQALSGEVISEAATGAGKTGLSKWLDLWPAKAEAKQ